MGRYTDHLEYLRFLLSPNATFMDRARQHELGCACGASLRDDAEGTPGPLGMLTLRRTRRWLMLVWLEFFDVEARNRRRQSKRSTRRWDVDMARS